MERQAAGSGSTCKNLLPDYDVGMTPYMQLIAQEWIARAEELAQWTYEHMVNRTDVWGSYLAMEKRRSREMSFYTAPFPAARGKQFLTKGMIAKHFAGLAGHLISLHSTSADKTSRWLAIDIDRHDGDEAVNPECNLAAAMAWHDRLAGMGFDPLLFDSNGNGGYHLIIIFSEPVPTADVYAFGRAVADSPRSAAAGIERIARAESVFAQTAPARLRGSGRRSGAV